MCVQSVRIFLKQTKKKRKRILFVFSNCMSAMPLAKQKSSIIEHMYRYMPKVRNKSSYKQKVPTFKMTNE